MVMILAAMWVIYN